MFMPKYDFEHYDSTETPWNLSLYFYFRSYFYYCSTCSLFLAIFSADKFSVIFYFTLLYTPISLCLSGNLLYFSIYIFLVSVATIYFPVLFFFDFPYCGFNLFLPHLILVSFLYSTSFYA